MTPKFEKFLSETAAKNQLITERPGEIWKRLLGNKRTKEAAERFLRWTRKGGNEPAKIGQPPLPGRPSPHGIGRPFINAFSKIKNPLHKSPHELAGIETGLINMRSPAQAWQNLSKAGKVVKGGQVAGTTAVAGGLGALGLHHFSRGGAGAGNQSDANATDANATVQRGSPQDMEGSGFADSNQTQPPTKKRPVTQPSAPAPSTNAPAPTLGPSTNAPAADDAVAKAVAAAAKLRAILDAARRKGDRIGSVTNIVPQIKR
jgi:hypothetical protein